MALAAGEHLPTVVASRPSGASCPSLAGLRDFSTPSARFNPGRIGTAQHDRPFRSRRNASGTLQLPFRPRSEAASGGTPAVPTPPDPLPRAKTPLPPPVGLFPSHPELPPLPRSACVPQVGFPSPTPSEAPIASARSLSVPSEPTIVQRSTTLQARSSHAPPSLGRASLALSKPRADRPPHPMY